MNNEERGQGGWTIAQSESDGEGEDKGSLGFVVVKGTERAQ